MASRSVTARWLLALTLVITGTCLRTAAKAASAAVLKVDETTEIDSIGNATVHSTMTAPTVVYTAMKTNTPNVALMFRKFGVGEDGKSWKMPMQNSTTSKIAWRSRTSSEDLPASNRATAGWCRWTKTPRLEMLESHDRSAIFQGTINSSGIIVNAHRTRRPAREEAVI